MGSGFKMVAGHRNGGHIDHKGPDRGDDLGRTGLEPRVCEDLETLMAFRGQGHLPPEPGWMCP